MALAGYDGRTILNLLPLFEVLIPLYIEVGHCKIENRQSGGNRATTLRYDNISNILIELLVMVMMASHYIPTMYVPKYHTPKSH